MSFLNTFSEISKNRNNFQRWEQEKADDEAQRKTYFAQKPPTEKELSEAKELGRVVVDSVEFMDTKSENKSEAVETTVETTTGIASALATIGTTFGVAKSGVKSFQEGQKHMHKVGEVMQKLNRNEHEEIIEDLLKHGLVEEHGKDNYKYILPKRSAFGYKIANKRRYERLSDATKAHFKDVVSDDLFKSVKKNKAFMTRLFGLPIVAGFAVTVAGQIFGTMAQLKASRIARFQAREQLSDTRNFVEYTDEQKAEAAKIAGGIQVPDEKESGAISDLISLGKDYEKYKQARGQNDVHLYDIQEDDPQKAAHRQEAINNAIKKINNQAEDYSENMETGAGIVLGSSFLGGALIGKASNWLVGLLNKKEAPKAETPAVEPKGVLQELEGFFTKAPEGEKQSVLKKAGNMVKVVAKSKPGAFGAILSALITAPLALKLQKDASRAGRYKARRDLEENPETFLYADKDALQGTQAKGQVKKDGFFDVIRFLPESIKASFEYSKYKKTEQKQRKKMTEALKHVQVSDEQMKKAEALKTRLYKSFDTVDDHSEEYSESMEAAAELGRSSLDFIPMAAMLIPAALFAKYPQKVTKVATDALAFGFKKVGWLRTKYTKGLGDNAAQKITRKVQRHIDYKRLSFAEKDINEALLTADNAHFDAKITELEAKLKAKLPHHEATSYVAQIRRQREFNNIVAKNPDVVADMEEWTKNPSGAINRFLPEHIFEETPENIEAWKKNLDKFSDILDLNSGFGDVKDDDIKKIMQNIRSLKETVPAEDLLAINTRTEQVFTNNPLMRMIANNNQLSLNTRELFVTKDATPIAATAAGAWIATTLGGTYAMESYLSSKTKQAGRIGTMKAIEELNAENAQAKLQTQT